MLNLILFHFDRNIDKFWPSVANYLLFFSKIAKKLIFALCPEIAIAEVTVSCASMWYKNAVPQLRNCAALQKYEQLNCAFDVMLFMPASDLFQIIGF